MHNTWVPTLKVKVTIRGEKSTHFFLATEKKNTVASVIKLHAKGNNNEMICFN